MSSDKLGRSELHYAALEGDPARVDALLANGVDPGVTDHQGFTPLHFAAQQQSYAAARLLLDHGAPVDSQNVFGNSPLFTAVFNSKGDGAVIELLRGHGADARLVNASGQRRSDQFTTRVGTRWGEFSDRNERMDQLKKLASVT
jgi:ankyrin repeat protein